MYKIKNLLRKRFENFPVKFRFFIPIVIGIIISISALTFLSVNKSRNYLDTLIRKDLSLNVKMITKMFQRERALKLDKVKIDLKIAHDIFYSKKLKISDEEIKVTAINQNTKQEYKTKIKKWYIDGRQVQNDVLLVDKAQDLFKGTATIFQKIDKGYLRISTNVLKLDGTRAVETFIPNSSDVVKAIERGETFFGRAFVVNDYYITAYEPIYYNGKIVGMLYVGDKEKDLNELRKIIYQLKIGKRGYPFVFDENGKIIMHPKYEGADFKNRKIIKYIIENKTGTTTFLSDDNEKMIVAFDYFKDFKLYIAATVYQKDEINKFSSGIIKSSILTGLIIIILLSVLVYFIAIENMQKYFEAFQSSNKQLADAKIALRQSEKLATMGQLSAGIAHELNNPLGVVIMYSNILLEECDKDSQMYEDLSLIVEQSNRCRKIVKGLLNFARKSQVNLEEVDIVSVVKQSIKSIIIPKDVNININEKINDKTINLDNEQMIQVFSNLTKNAIEAMKEKGNIDISFEETKEEITINIKDSGPGIPEENIPKLFTPFYTTKEIGKGTGLGLATVYGIVKMHKGRINVTSNTDKSNGPTWTNFKIVLPRNPQKLN
ncbi:MAG: Cache 3/Cache 2 fusion domain-containing protein [Bacteroidales bacterium]|nr:Cache 3/Cache 2 fusion domain-containing protein [Bacteroidales bacterium]